MLPTRRSPCWGARPVRRGARGSDRHTSSGDTPDESSAGLAMSTTRAESAAADEVDISLTCGSALLNFVIAQTFRSLDGARSDPQTLRPKEGLARVVNHS